MNTRKIFYGLFVTSCLIVASCTADSSDDALYEVGVKRIDVRKSNKESVKRIDVRKSNKESVKRIDVRKSNR